MSTKQGETEQEGMGHLLLVYIILSVMLVIVVIFILVFWTKKCSISHRAAENGVGSATHDFVSPSTQYDPVETDNHDETVGK